MKICMICPGLGNTGGNALIGGPENIAARLSKALFQRGHEISIVTTPHLHPGNKPNNSFYGEVYSLPIHSPYLSFRYGVELLLKSLWKIKEMSAKENFDIIHGHSGHPMPALITGIGGRILGIPSIHTLYCPMRGGGTYYPHQIFLAKPISKFYLFQLDKIVTLSKRNKDGLKSMGIKDKKIEIITPVIDLTQFNQSISGEGVKKQLNLDTNPVLLYVGDLARSRGAHVLVEALNKLKNQFPDIKLLFAVNMPRERYKREKLEIKEKISSFGLNDNIIPLGIVNNMPQIMAASDVFIAPYTDIEGIVDYPISILEAMAVGKSVIASEVGGIPEIIAHHKNGLLIRPNDPIELAKAIVYMLNNKKEARKMGMNGAKTVSENFRTEKVVDKLEKVYEEVISNYSGSRRH